MTLAEAKIYHCVAQLDHHAQMDDLLRQRLLENGWDIVNTTPFFSRNPE
jgi:hypothetical protein